MTRKYTVKPTPDMLTETRADGSPAHYRVYAEDGTELGAVAAGLGSREWLPTAGVGHHGPTARTLAAAARWVAENSETTPDICNARRTGWTPGLAFGDRRRLPCVLRRGHEGPHRNAFDDTWNEDDMPAEPREDVPATLVDTYVNELSVLMANLGHPAHASARIRQCDRLFSAIDHHMRHGEPLPFVWRVNRNAGVSGPEAMDAVYDALSEALRERGGVVADRVSLDIARREWERLDGLIRDGSPLPSPWKRRKR